MPVYKIIDFDGYIAWVKPADGKYAVDPLYEEFLKLYRKVHSDNGGL